MQTYTYNQLCKCKTYNYNLCVRDTNLLKLVLSLHVALTIIACSGTYNYNCANAKPITATVLMQIHNYNCANANLITTTNCANAKFIPATYVSGSQTASRPNPFWLKHVYYLQTELWPICVPMNHKSLTSHWLEACLSQIVELSEAVVIRPGHHIAQSSFQHSGAFWSSCDLSGAITLLKALSIIVELSEAIVICRGHHIARSSSHNSGAFWSSCDSPALSHCSKLFPK